MQFLLCPKLFNWLCGPPSLLFFQWVGGALSPGVRQPRHEANYPALSSAAVNLWITTSNSLTHLYGVIFCDARGQLCLYMDMKHAFSYYKGRTYLHFPTTNLTLVQRGVLYSGIKIYNHLPTHIKSLLKDPKQFKLKLKSFLLEQSLYSLEEFYQVTSKEF